MRIPIRSKLALMYLVSLIALLSFGIASASAAEPWWHLTSGSAPANLPPEGRGEIVLTAANLGDADANGTRHRSRSPTPSRLG